MKLFEWAASLLFPARCPYCGCVIEGGALCCGSCEGRLRRISVPVCTACNVEIGPYHRSCGGFPCAAPLSYQGAARHALLQFKFYGKKPYAEPLSGQMEKMIRALEWPAKIDLVTFVPMTRRSRRERGYNQAEELAERLARRLQKPCVPLLCKIRENEAQHRLSAAQRKRNVRGAYGLIDADLVKDKVILLCDDIITTGATLQECAGQLQKLGAAQVLCAAVARREVVME